MTRPGPDLDWVAVSARYAGRRAVSPLAGNSTLRVCSAGDSLVVVQRLWRAVVTRAELVVALELLGDRPPETRAVGFSEELRRYYSGGPQVQPSCSRTPNLCAVMLADLGRLTV